MILECDSKVEGRSRNVRKYYSFSVSDLRFSGWPSENLQSFVFWDCVRSRTSCFSLCFLVLFCFLFSFHEDECFPLETFPS